MSTKLLIVDLREETELLDVQLKSNTSAVDIVNIPTRSIFANLDFINKKANELEMVYLMCRSGCRSQKVKNKYFPSNPRVQLLEGGWKNPQVLQSSIKVINRSSISNMSPQQYMQMVIVLFLVSAIAMNQFDVNKTYVSLYLGAMAAFILYQILTKDCLMTSMIPLSSITPK